MPVCVARSKSKSKSTSSVNEGGTDIRQLPRGVPVRPVAGSGGVDLVEHVRADFDDVRPVAAHVPLRVEPDT